MNRVTEINVFWTDTKKNYFDIKWTLKRNF